MNDKGFPSTGAAEENDELVRVLDAYLAGVDAGRPVDPEELIAEHPGIADRLRECLGVFGLAEQLGGDPDAVRDAGPVTPPRSRLGDFRLIRPIGRGGMGVVYEAEQISLRRRVALKVMSFAAAFDPKQLQRFQLEAHAAACLHHTNIVPVHAVGTERGVPYYAMQLIEGPSLAEVIHDRRRLEGLEPEGVAPHDLAGMSTSTLAAELLTGQFGARLASHGSDSPTVEHSTGPPPSASPREGLGRKASSTGGSPRSASSTHTRDYIRNVANLGLQAAEALDHAHTRGILHRDIKPANLLLGADGNLWVTDFGLAQVQGNPGLTLTGDVLGTMRYMSPEQALGRRVVIDARTDVYSLGATLYEMLSLRPAFDGKDRAEILWRIAEREPVPLRTLNPAVPIDLETIVATAMSKDLATRYATARDLADDLRSHLEDRPIRARRPSLADRAAKWARRHRQLVASAAVTLLMAAMMLAGGIGYVVRDRAARLAHTEQSVAVALAGARIAIQAADLMLASRAVAEANAYLGADRERLPRVAADIDRVRQEIEARQADEARMQEFLKLASDAQDKMNYVPGDSGGDRLIRKALGLYGMLEADDWLSRLENSYLTGDKKEEVRESAYVMLVTLADSDGRQPGLSVDRKSFQSCLDLLRRARAFHEPTRAFYFVRSECHRGQGNEAAASEDVKRFQTTPAKTAWDYFLPGQRAAWGGDLDEAIRSYRAALRLQPNHFNSLWFLAHRFNTDKIDRRPEAIQLFTACLALRPDSVPSLVGRSSCYLQLGFPDDAIADCREAIRLRPDYVNAYLNLGNALSKVGRLDEVIATYRELIRLKPDDASVCIDLGQALLRHGKLDEAIAACREAIRLKPDYGCAYNVLGMALRAQEKLDEALAAFKEAVRLGPADHVDHLNGLAWLLATHPKPQLRNPARAVELARKAVELVPTSGGIWNTIGVAEYRAGEWDQAIKALTKSMELTSGGTPADWLFLALAHNRRGERDQARSWYDKAVARMDEKPSKDEELLRFRVEAEDQFGTGRPSREKAPAPRPH